jgi:hypothetical protein
MITVGREFVLGLDLDLGSAVFIRGFRSVVQLQRMVWFRVHCTGDNIEHPSRGCVAISSADSGKLMEELL